MEVVVCCFVCHVCSLFFVVTMGFVVGVRNGVGVSRIRLAVLEVYSGGRAVRECGVFVV